jgi:serine/threonine protein kinase
MSAAAEPDGRNCPMCGAHVPRANAYCGACGANIPVTAFGDDDGLLGRVIDSRFRVLQLLGAGGMGAVYLAEHVGIGKKVAVKVLRGDLRNRPDLVSRFRREAMAVSKLADAHTITVFDFGVWKGLVYLVMEYLRGQDLAQVLQNEGRLAPGRALRLARQVCSSLAEAHAVGIVHRDLKPENLYVTRSTNGDELLKVLDFGLAKMVAGTERAEGNFQTADGALLGTPYFMAPEQVRGDGVDARSDLYALGALLYRMLTGVYPFVGRTPMEVLEGHLSGRLRPFAEAAPALSVPAGCEGLVRQLMSRDPAHRPATALAVDAALVELLEAAGEGGFSAPPVAAAAISTPDGQPRALANTFSTSALADPEPLDAEPPDLGSVVSAPPTRDDFERYERRLRLRRLSGWLVTLALLGGGGAAAWYYGMRAPEWRPPSQEIEPNDDSPQATRMAPGTPISGHLGRRQSKERSDRDVFALDVPPGGAYAAVDLTAVPGIDLIVEGFAVDGTRLFQHSAAGVGEGERFVAPTGGRERVLIVVREVWVHGELPRENSTDAYTLTVSFQASGPSTVGDAGLPGARE